MESRACIRDTSGICGASSPRPFCSQSAVVWNSKRDPLPVWTCAHKEHDKAMKNVAGPGGVSSPVTSLVLPSILPPVPFTEGCGGGVYEE